MGLTYCITNEVLECKWDTEDILLWEGVRVCYILCTLTKFMVEMLAIPVSLSAGFICFLFSPLMGLHCPDFKV